MILFPSQYWFWPQHFRQPRRHKRGRKERRGNNNKKKNPNRNRSRRVFSPALREKRNRGKEREEEEDQTSAAGHLGSTISVFVLFFLTFSFDFRFVPPPSSPPVVTVSWKITSSFPALDSRMAHDRFQMVHRGVPNLETRLVSWHTWPGESSSSSFSSSSSSSSVTFWLGNDDNDADEADDDVASSRHATPLPLLTSWPWSIEQRLFLSLRFSFVFAFLRLFDSHSYRYGLSTDLVLDMLACRALCVVPWVWSFLVFLFCSFVSFCATGEPAKSATSQRLADIFAGPARLGPPSGRSNRWYVLISNSKPSISKRLVKTRHKMSATTVDW